MRVTLQGKELIVFNCGWICGDQEGVQVGIYAGVGVDTWILHVFVAGIGAYGCRCMVEAVVPGGGWIYTGDNVSEGICGHKDICARWVVGVLGKSGGQVDMCEKVVTARVTV